MSSPGSCHPTAGTAEALASEADCHDWNPSSAASHPNKEGRHRARHRAPWDRLHAPPPWSHVSANGVVPYFCKMAAVRTTFASSSRRTAPGPTRAARPTGCCVARPDDALPASAACPATTSPPPPSRSSVQLAVSATPRANNHSARPFASNMPVIVARVKITFSRHLQQELLVPRWGHFESILEPVLYAGDSRQRRDIPDQGIDDARPVLRGLGA